MISVQEIKSRNCFRVVGPKGAKTWNINKMGRRLAKKFAENYARELNDAIEADNLAAVYDEHTIKEGIVAFHQDFEVLVQEGERDDCSARQYKNLLKRIEESSFTNHRMKAFLMVDAKELQRELLTKYSRDAVKKSMKALKYVMVKAVERGWLSFNPISEYKFKNQGMNRDAAVKKDSEIKIPTPIEVKSLLQVMDIQWKTFFTILATTGLRASELRGLGWNAIDFENNWIHVGQQADQKNRLTSKLKNENAIRSIPLLASTKAALVNWKNDPDAGLNLVFETEHGNPYAHGFVWQKLEYYKKLAGLKFTGALHSFRHYYASILIDENKKGNISVLQIPVFLGHGSFDFTSRVYGHLLESAMEHNTLVNKLSSSPKLELVA